MTRKFSKITIYFLFIAFLFLPNFLVEAHSFVVEESPIANSILDTSPSEVSIQFNSKVDKNFSLKVLDESAQEIKVKSAMISDDHKRISVQIPQLPNGQYKVKYYIISSNDGHSVEGSYFFQVKWNVPPLINNEYIYEETGGGIINKEELITPQEAVNDSNVESDGHGDEELSKASIYITKSIYYLGFLLTVGWIFLWQTISTYSFEVRKKYLFYGMIFQLLHLIGLIAFLLAQMNVFTTHGIVFEFDFPLETNFGKLWIASLGFALIGFLFLFKNRVFDYFWIISIGILKSLSGHPKDFEPESLLVSLNSFHLFAASFWAAGIVYILLFWRKQRLYVKSFLPIFSKGALLSIILLTFTGSIIAYLYLPNREAILIGWGLALLVKIVVVVAVIIAGAIIRRKMKQGKVADLESMIKFDFILMLILIIIISILTSLNPLP